MIYKAQKDLTVVVYEDKKAAKCIQLKKPFIRRVMFLIPTFCLLSLAVIMAITINFKYIREKIKLQEPAIINELEEKNLALSNENTELKEFNQTLTDKLSSKVVSATNLFTFFRPTPGQQDLQKQKSVEIENLDVKIENSKVNISFNIVNELDSGQKFAGHVFVVFKKGATVQIYPETNESNDLDSVTSFKLGERFTVSRFRPVEAKFFNIDSQSSIGIFKVVIFNRTGDLVRQIDHGPVALN